METNFHEDSYSSEDNEVFCYPAPKCEVLRRFTEPTNGPKTTRALSESDTSTDSSVELIEAQSEPELLQDSPSPEKSPAIRRIRRSVSQPDLRKSLAPCTWETAVSEESFLATEALVSQIVDLSSGSDDLDNTLEKIEEILKAGSEKKETNITLRKQDVNTSKSVTPRNIKTHNNASTLKKSTLRGVKASPVFKTPANTNRLQKPIYNAGRSPMRGPSPFKNIASPVGFYIKNSPQAPLLQTVRPRRPLPGWSAIPKPVELPRKVNKENVSINLFLNKDSSPNKENVSSKFLRNKENVSNNLLPPKAYVSAKQTKLIMTPDTKYLPRNNQVKKMASALSHPTVMRHERREKMPTINTTALATRPDESFAKLSISQADVSVCVVKSAGFTETLKRN